MEKITFFIKKKVVAGSISEAIRLEKKKGDVLEIWKEGEQPESEAAAPGFRTK